MRAPPDVCSCRKGLAALSRDYGGEWIAVRSGPRQVHDLAYNAFRDATRDAVAEVAARDILSQ